MLFLDFNELFSLFLFEKVVHMVMVVGQDSFEAGIIISTPDRLVMIGMMLFTSSCFGE